MAPFRKVNCGVCAPCKRPECGKCIYCRDKPKFGGNNSLRQRCIKRKCTNKVIPDAARGKRKRENQHHSGSKVAKRIKLDPGAVTTARTHTNCSGNTNKALSRKLNASAPKKVAHRKNSHIKCKSRARPSNRSQHHSAMSSAKRCPLTASRSAKNGTAMGKRTREYKTSLKAKKSRANRDVKFNQKYKHMDKRTKEFRAFKAEHKRNSPPNKSTAHSSTLFNVRRLPNSFDTSMPPPPEFEELFAVLERSEEGRRGKKRSPWFFIHNYNCNRCDNEDEEMMGDEFDDIDEDSVMDAPEDLLDNLQLNNGDRNIFSDTQRWVNNNNDTDYMSLNMIQCKTEPVSPPQQCSPVGNFSIGGSDKENCWAGKRTGTLPMIDPASSVSTTDTGTDSVSDLCADSPLPQSLIKPAPPASLADDCSSVDTPLSSTSTCIGRSASISSGMSTPILCLSRCDSPQFGSSFRFMSGNTIKLEPDDVLMNLDLSSRRGSTATNSPVPLRKYHSTTHVKGDHESENLLQADPFVSLIRTRSRSVTPGLDSASNSPVPCKRRSLLIGNVTSIGNEQTSDNATSVQSKPNNDGRAPTRNGSATAKAESTNSESASDKATTFRGRSSSERSTPTRNGPASLVRGDIALLLRDNHPVSPHDFTGKRETRSRYKLKGSGKVIGMKCMWKSTGTRWNSQSPIRKTDDVCSSPQQNKAYKQSRFLRRDRIINSPIRRCSVRIENNSLSTIHKEILGMASNQPQQDFNLTFQKFMNPKENDIQGDNTEKELEINTLSTTKVLESLSSRFTADTDIGDHDNAQGSTSVQTTPHKSSSATTRGRHASAASAPVVPVPGWNFVSSPQKCRDKDGKPLMFYDFMAYAFEKN